MPVLRPALRRHLLVLLLYTLLGLALTYPMVARFTTHVPGDGIDDPALAWNLWWIKFSLVDRQINPFPSQWMFYPIGINLAFYTLTILNGLLSVPLQVSLGLVPASNLVLLSSFVLSGYGAYLLALQVVGAGGKGGRSKETEETRGRDRRIVSLPQASLILHLAAFLAGVLYAFSSSKMFYAALGQFNIASSQWIPFAVLYIVRSCSLPVRRPAGTSSQPPPVRRPAGTSSQPPPVRRPAEASLPFAPVSQPAGTDHTFAPVSRPALAGRVRVREASMAALFMLLQAYAELTYASFLLIFLALFAGYRLVQIALAKRRNDDSSCRTLALAHLLRSLAIIAVVFLVGLLPVLANMLPDMRAEGDFLVEGGGFADIFSADLAGYALPTQLHPLLGGIVRQASGDSQLRPDGSQWQVNKGQHLTLGLVGLGLAVLGLWSARRRPGAWFWAASALVFFLLTLGPALRIAGQSTGIPGPFALLQELPFFKGNRYPSRFSVMLLVSVVPLVAWGAQWVLGRMATRRADKQPRPVRRPAGTVGVPELVRRPAGTEGTGDAPVFTQVSRPAVAARWLAGAAAGLAGLLIFENLSVPLPVSDMRIPAIYERIAADPGDFAVLDLPLGWRNGFSVFGKQDLVIMAQQWAQTEHGKPILGGNTSRNPEHKFRYFLDAPLIGPLTVLANATDANPHIRTQLADALAALRAGDPGLAGNTMLLEAAADASQALQTLNTRYVVVHTDRVPPEFVAFVEQYLPVRRIADDGQRILYSVDLPAPPDQDTVRPAEDPLSRGEGWSGRGQVQVEPGDEPPALWAQRAETRLLLPPLQPGPYRLTLRAAAAGPGQTAALEVNGYETEAQPLGTEWTELAFDVPAGVLSGGANEVLLRFDQTYPAEEAQLPASGSRPRSLLVESASLEAGNYAHIWLDGRDVSPNLRGYNLAIIDAETWQPVAAAAFDTHLDPAASAAMMAFLQQVGPDDVLAVAVRDTASDQLSAEAAQALANLGLTDLRGRFRWSQAAIVPGAGAQAVEQVSGLQPVSVGWGQGWREPQVAAAVEWLSAERVGE